MKRSVLGFGILALGIAVISLGGCSTCGTPYRSELTRNRDLAEANESYKKAIDWLGQAECASTPTDAQQKFTTGESYITDAIFKLKKSGHDNNIDVSEDLYYCEKIKRETDVKIGQDARQR